MEHPLPDDSHDITETDGKPVVAPPATLLRFLTCGSVDDGKSTLIGRLLFEAGAVSDDQLAALDSDSLRHGTTGGRDYALLVDGLAAEREQGITIDVAYRYFSTPRRAFIVADTPGHEQYTRNMATGASTADLAVILIDASKGVLPQTRRHAYIAAMLGIRHVILAINKMDAVDHAAERFAAIEKAALADLQPLAFTTITAIPLVARNGDNIVRPSAAMPWYQGPGLLTCLEQVKVTREAQAPFRFAVQWVNRPDQDFRGFAGLVASGEIEVGDAIRALPSGAGARVRKILSVDGERQSAIAGQTPTLLLDREIDISRGDVIVAGNDPLRGRKHVPVRLLWMSAAPFDPGRRLRLKLATSTANVSALTLNHLVDIHNYTAIAPGTLRMNAIAAALLALDQPLIFTEHADNRLLGSFILIDALSGETVALGIVDSKANNIRVLNKARAPLWRRLFRPTGERPLRSIAKAVTWRVTGSLDTFLLSWFFTHSAKLAAAISVTEVLTKLVLYYTHERAWARSRFGLASPDHRTPQGENTEGAGI